MPIQVKCSCGKVLKVRDELAGKAVKCPGCQNALRVPAGGATPPAPGAAAAPSAAARPATPKAAAPANPMDDLFSEAGFEQRKGKVCPKCFATIASDAVFCTHCGFNLQTGTRSQGHQLEFDSTDEGARMLRKAENNMQSASEMQLKLATGAGMPWWMLMMVLFVLGSAVGIGAIIVNNRKASDEAAAGNFDAIDTMLMLVCIGFATLGGGALLNTFYRAIRYRKFGFYIRPLLLAIVAGAIAGGAYAYRVSR